MKTAPPFLRPARNARSIHPYLPLASLLFLVLSRTALHQTRFSDSAFGSGVGLLLGYVLLSAFPSVFQPKEPEDNDLQTLNLSR